MTKINRSLLLVTLLVFCLCFAGCIDRGSTLYKKIANDAEKREAKATEELIGKSSELQNLEKICRDLPFFREAEPKVKAISKQNDKLFYHYDLQVDFDYLKTVFEKQLPQNGWALKKENRGIWENQLEFEKGNYWIQISNGNFGESNYGTSCQDSKIAR